MLLVGAATTPASAQSIRDKQWHLTAMKAQQMWKTSTGRGVTVAVIDSGVDGANPDLKGRVLRGKDLAQSSQPGDEWTDPDGHGTAMAALIASTGASAGGTGALGLAPGVKILPVRMPAPGDVNQVQGDRRFNTALASAIRYAADSGAEVINVSQGTGAGSAELTDAVKYALGKDSLVFASVGNSGNAGNRVEYPGATPGVVGVGAVGKDLRRTAESEHGAQVDMAAPGEDLVQACDGKTGVCVGHGTSGATALASASAALIWSAHPTWTNNQVLRVMLNTIGAPTDGRKRNDSIGYGIVRPRVALTDPGDPGPADRYPLPDSPAAASASPHPAKTGTAAPEGLGHQFKHEGPGGSSSDDPAFPILWLTVGIAAFLAVAIVIATAFRRRPM